MSFIKQISQAIKKQKPCRKQNRVATHFLLMFSFALVGISFLLYGAIGGQLAKAQTVGWYNDGGTWSFRQKITINPDKVTGSLTNFPVLVQMNQIDNNANPIFGKALPNGWDILFTASDGTTKLSHEIAEYSEAGGYLQAWVKVPALVGSTLPATSLYMYYGNASASDQGDTINVWDSNFKMVQHLKDDSTTTTKDSTANNNQGTKIAVGQPAEVVGKIGMAQSFNGNGKISTPLNTAFGDFTIETWFQDASGVNNTYERLLDKSYTAGFWLGRNNNANSWGGGIREGVPPYGIFGTFNDGMWNHLVSVRSNTTHLLYANGVLVNSNTVVGTPLNDTSIALGAWSDPSQTQQRLSGALDEVRVSDIPRSVDWIKTSYDNENDPASFVTFSPEETYVEPPSTTIVITAPVATSEWKIGDTEDIAWSVITPLSIDHYDLSYQEVGATLWTPIADDAMPPNYPWLIPMVSNLGGTFKVKIEAHDIDNNIVVVQESEGFNIDYGPVDNWNLEATIDGYPLRPAEGLIDTSQISLNTAFTLAATAKDVHGNTITNQVDPINLGIIILGGGGGGVVVSITPDSLGTASSSVWNQGTASFDNYRFSVALSGGTLPVTFNLTTNVPSQVIKMQLSGYGIFVFEPESTADWIVGETRDIVFKFGGFAPANPSTSFARFYYSQTGNWTTPYPVKDENGNDRQILYAAGQQLINVPWLLPNTLDITKPVEIKAEFYDNNGTPADPSDDIILASDISDSFNLGGVIALEGTYVSAKFNISDTPTTDTFLNFSDVNGFTATYGEDIGHSDVGFSLSFFDSSDQLLGTAVNPDGWFVLDDLDFDASMAVLNSYNWLDQIKQIQFRIKLQTTDYNSYSPYVEFLELSYEIDTATVVGIMNFESGNTKSVARNSSADFGVRLAITSGYESQIGEIVLRGEADDTTITTSPVIITGTGAVNYTTNVSFATTNLTPLGDHAISISAEVTGHPEMTFTPSLLTGVLTVTDATAQDFSLTWVGSPPDINKTVQPGGMASYNFIVTWDQSYSPDIILTTDITTVIGTSYIASVEYYDSNGVIVPGNTAVKPLVAPYIKTIELRVTTKTNGGEKTLTTFTITGTGNNIPKNITPAPSLTISNQPANAIIVDAKAEVEGGTAASFASPAFTVRLYKKGNTSIYTEKTGVLAVSKDATTGKYVMRASFDKATTDTAGKVVTGTTYIGYLRSIRHFWKKATLPTSSEITIIAGTNSYTLEFPKLSVGDISPTIPDNEINSLDFQSALANFGQTLNNALNDFDNNGQINVIDVGFVLLNYFTKGDVLPS